MCRKLCEEHRVACMLTQVKPVGLEVRGLARHAQRDHRTVAKLVDERVELVDPRVDLLVRVRVRVL